MGRSRLRRRGLIRFVDVGGVGSGNSDRACGMLGMGFCNIGLRSMGDIGYWDGGIRLGGCDNMIVIPLLQNSMMQGRDVCVLIVHSCLCMQTTQSDPRCQPTFYQVARTRLVHVYV